MTTPTMQEVLDRVRRTEIKVSSLMKTAGLTPGQDYRPDHFPLRVDVVAGELRASLDNTLGEVAVAMHNCPLKEVRLIVGSRLIGILVAGD